MTATTTAHEAITAIIDPSNWSDEIKAKFYQFLEKDKRTNDRLVAVLTSPKHQEYCTPLITYEEAKDSFLVIFADTSQPRPEPGEEGSLLSYYRAYGYGKRTICSDCYGQLSCSSCSVEVLGGEPVNPEPREEEYDMLDIDEAKPATKYSRLSCQTVVGQSPLVLTIR